MEQVFVSDRIRFVAVSERLIPEYLCMINDWEHVERFFAGAREPYTEEQEREWVQSVLARHATVFSMLEKDSGAFIGNIEIMDAHDGAGELGIVITANMQNKGYGTEAVRALTAYAMKECGLKRIFLRTRIDNARALRVYQTCGFRELRRTDTHVVMEFDPK